MKPKSQKNSTYVPHGSEDIYREKIDTPMAKISKKDLCKVTSETGVDMKKKSMHHKHAMKHSKMADKHHKMAEHHLKKAHHHDGKAAHHHEKHESMHKGMMHEKDGMMHKKHHSKVGKEAVGKFKKVMHEFKEHSLHSGSKKGPKVTNPKQAVAIAYSEDRKMRKKHGEKIW